ncbi:MAG: hypothetical protein HYU27_00435 [Acidobacteria bacterium]|nr:hypothetical protein [Acidobacteriota bacterium]
MQYRDYEEFIAALNDQGARYLIVGAHAVAYHARPRATKDFDILVDPTPINARKTLVALNAFLGGDLGYSVDDLLDPDSFIQIGVAPVRIDIMSSLKGCPDFAAIWKNRIEAAFGSQPACYLGLKDLIDAKLAADRIQDRADIRVLRRAQSRQRY